MGKIGFDLSITGDMLTLTSENRASLKRLGQVNMVPLETSSTLTSLSDGDSPCQLAHTDYSSPTAE